MKKLIGLTAVAAAALTFMADPPRSLMLLR